MKVAKNVKVVVTKLGMQNAKELNKKDQELLDPRYAMFFRASSMHWACCRGPRAASDAALSHEHV